ncbi:ABC transporter permease [Engelhardtia mirabilis]
MPSRSFLSSAWLVAWHDLRLNLRQKETLLWTFLMPALFFWFIGTVTSGFGGADAGPSIALRSGADAGFIEGELAARLTDGGATVVYPDDDPEGTAFEDYRRRIELPEHLTERVLSGESVALTFRRREAGLGASLDAFTVRRATYGVLADLITLAATGAEINAASMQALRTQERALKVEVSTAGNLERVPSGFQQAVPGTMVMFTLVVLLTSGASILIGERKSGALLRLAAAPIPRGSVVLGKWFGNLMLGGIQVSFAVLLGTFAFGVQWGPEPLALAAVLAAYAGMIAAIAILLGNLARSEGQAVGLAVVAGNVLGALGGCWWPIEVTPKAMQSLAMFLPTGWTMDALHRLMAFGQPAVSVVPHVAGMTLATLLCGWLAAKTFRFA